MELLRHIKKAASLLLLACLLLPLSQCTKSTRDGKQEVIVSYGYQTIIPSTDELANGDTNWEDLPAILIYAAFFFAPLITLFLKAPIQQITAILSIIPACLVVNVHLFMFTPRIGIWLGTLLWLIIAIASFLELYSRYIKQQKIKCKT